MTWKNVEPGFVKMISFYKLDSTLKSIQNSTAAQYSDRVRMAQ
jgi:hypothetical protein